MKKAVITLGIFATVTLVWGIVNFIPQSGIELGDREEATTTVAAEAVKNPAFPAYNGWPIDNIGNDSFIEQAPQEVVEQHKKELAELKKSLTENPNNSEGWLKAGLLQKFFNNYIGARDMWEYGKLVAPNDFIFYYNLGGLYGLYFKNYPKAEFNYQQAMAINPLLPYLYLGLAEFYSVFYTEKADQAVEVIKKGLALLADEPALKQALEYYQAK